MVLYSVGGLESREACYNRGGGAVAVETDAKSGGLVLCKSNLYIIWSVVCRLVTRVHEPTRRFFRAPN